MSMPWQGALQDMSILALAGGVGGGKLARGLAAMLPPERLTIVVNTADDFVHLGLHISPDIDSVLYALADLNDPERGWGLSGESWNFMGALQRLGGATWFKLGDNDLAMHVLRTQELAAGSSLSKVTALLSKRLGVMHSVVPMTDNAVRSVIDTDEGPLAFQDYFVRRNCEPRFRGVHFRGADAAMPNKSFTAAIEQADAIVFSPSNPFVSIDPILAMAGVADALARRRGPIIAISPIVGGAAVKGPLAKMLRDRGLGRSPMSIAQHYGRRVDGWIIDVVDRVYASAIERLGCRVHVRDTMMRTLDDKRRLAQDVLEFAIQLAKTTVS
jgi:LPPG:FO 2-phospho-L-lactate transferase